MITQTISLDSEQHAWLKNQPAGISGTIRILVDGEMARLRKHKAPNNAELTEEVKVLRETLAQREAALRDQANALLEAQQRAGELAAAAKTEEDKERERQERWHSYRGRHKDAIAKLSIQELKVLHSRVVAGDSSPPPSPAPQKQEDAT